MVVDERATAIPCGFESAVFKLDAMCKRDGVGPCSVYVCGDGRPTISKYNQDGSKTVLTLLDGEWRQLKHIGEGVNEWQQ